MQKHLIQLSFILLFAVLLLGYVYSAHTKEGTETGSPKPPALSMTLTEPSELEKIRQFAGEKDVLSQLLSADHWKPVLLQSAQKLVALSEKRFESIQDTYGQSPRFFDPGWLQQPGVKFTLTGVILRPDKGLLFHTTASHCAELRYLFRLHYNLETEKGPRQSDLPFTLAAIAPLGELALKNTPQNEGPEPDCRTALQAIVESGKLPELALSVMKLPQAITDLEFNFQLARFPHDGTPGFSEQAHYGLGRLERTVGKEATTWQAGTLANQVDSPSLQNDPEAKAKLWEFITQDSSQELLRKGQLEIPAEFLSTTALSATPYGLGRMVNRPFSQLFANGGHEHPNKSLLLRRLDTLSCTGCHASQSVAGFHFLGNTQANPEAPALQQMMQPWSPYFERIQEWRRDVLKGEASEKPFPGRAAKGQLGEACGSFAHAKGNSTNWSCNAQAALRCELGMPQSSLFPGLGECVPQQPRVGASCDTAVLHSDQADPFADRYVSNSGLLCGPQGLPGQICNKSTNGFPGGFCTTLCDPNRPSSPKTHESGEHSHSTCMPVPTNGPFTACLEAGNEFRNCLEKHNTPVRMPNCQKNSDCRQGYLCARVNAGGGICAPQYFLHELAIEDHPVGEARRQEAKGH